MVSTKQIRLAAIAFAIVLTGSIFAGPVFALDKPQEDAIIQNCDNIKQSLIKLQHADSRTRTYLGSAYEAISGRFITPLNLRLVKNNLPSTELLKIQSEFNTSQTAFRDKYVEYMRELENLIATECKTHPDEFYRKLETTRTKREELRKITKKISELVDQQYATVETLKGAL